MGGDPARLLVSLLAAEKSRCMAAVEELVEHFGPLVSISRPLTFVHGGYYNGEMGPGLSRRVVAFDELVEPDHLENIKRLCMGIEKRMSIDGKRTVNIDPGLLSAGSLVLATHKPGEHRLPLGPGLYCELTLFFHQGRFQPQVWTYRDYASEEMIQLLSLLRQRYLWQLRHHGSGNKEPDND